MMRTLNLIVIGLVLSAWTTGHVRAQQAQPQQQQQQQQGQPQAAGAAAPLEDEEYYDDEAIEEPQQTPVAAAAPPPPPVARPTSSLFSRPSTAATQSGRPSSNVHLQRQTTQPPTPAPVEPAATAAPTHTRTQPAAQAGTAAADSNEFFECPEKFGFFPHHRSCDKYWKCDEGQSSLKTCGNGLIFDATDLKRESCNYPFAADCGDRTELEPPQSTEFCPRLYGIFADEGDCRIFWSCWGGEAKKYECAPGLAFDESNRVCTWADKVNRCQKKEIAEGFSCPDPASVEAASAGTYTRHGHPEDCRKFFVCIEHTPRMYGCELGTVFNLETLMCDDPENVQGCEDYYGELDVKTLKKAQLSGFVNQPEKKVQPKAAAAAASAAAEV